MKKKLLAIVAITLLTFAFSACTEEDNTNPTGPTEHKVTGTVVDAEGNAVANITVTATAGSVSKNATTGADGKYSITGLETDLEYTVTATSDNYYFKPEMEQVTLSEDKTVDFTAVSIYGTWLSEGNNVAILLYGPPFNIRSITATFNTNGSYTVVQEDSSGAQTTLTGTFTMSKSSVDNIFNITLEQQTPSALTAEGIFEIYSDTAPFTMKYEVVQTSPDIGATPPTAAAGFGSTNGGALGTINVQTYVRQ